MKLEFNQESLLLTLIDKNHLLQVCPKTIRYINLVEEGSKIVSEKSSYGDSNNGTAVVTQACFDTKTKTVFVLVKSESSDNSTTVR